MSKSDLAYIKGAWDTTPVKDIAKRLNRAPETIRHAAKKMKLAPKKRAKVVPEPAIWQVGAMCHPAGLYTILGRLYEHHNGPFYSPLHTDERAALRRLCTLGVVEENMKARGLFRITRQGRDYVEGIANMKAAA